jgi:hypothetical protein
MARGIRARRLRLERNRMNGAEDYQFSFPLQGPENTIVFFGFAVALNVGTPESA